MRTTFLTLAAASLALAGCTREPVDIPTDLAKAAPICFLTQAMTIRDANDFKEGDPVSLSLYAATIKYPMIAAAKDDGFDPTNSILPLIPDNQELVDDLNTKDYEAAVPQCNKLFGVRAEGKPATLPENDGQASMSCYGMVQYMNGVIQAEDINTEGKDEFFAELTKRLEASFEALIEADPETFAAITSDESAEQMINEAIKGAFAQGDPLAYLEACDKRFTGKVVSGT